MNSSSLSLPDSRDCFRSAFTNNGTIGVLFSARSVDAVDYEIVFRQLRLLPNRIVN